MRPTPARMDAMPSWLALGAGLGAGAGLGFWLAAAPFAPGLVIVALLALSAAWKLGDACHKNSLPTPKPAPPQNDDTDDLLL